MKRRVSIEIDLSDEELAKIVPSGTVWLDISSFETIYAVYNREAEILKVVDVPQTSS